MERIIIIRDISEQNMVILGYCSDERAYDPWLQNLEEQMAKYIIELKRCFQQFLPEQFEILKPDGIIVLGRPTGRLVRANMQGIAAQICEIPHPGSRDFSKSEREGAFHKMKSLYHGLRKI